MRRNVNPYRKSDGTWYFEVGPFATQAMALFGLLQHLADQRAGKKVALADAGKPSQERGQESPPRA